MFTAKFVSIFCSTIFCGLLALTQCAQAAELKFNLISDKSDNGSATVEVLIDPQSKNLNVVEGSINFSQEGSGELLADIETGGSMLTIWPVKPEYTAGEKIIRFTGGIPGGFSKEGLLFRIRIIRSLPGTATISWIGGKAYLNDGKGTEENIFAKSLTISLGASGEVTAGNGRDTTPPVFGKLEIGNDPDTFDGNYFISFNATDDMSGVEYFEVREGDATTRLTEGTYIFKDQDQKTPVTITVFDKAGNSKSVEVPAQGVLSKNAIILLTALVAGLISATCLYAYKRRKK